MFGRQHPLDGPVRYPVRIHVIELDDRRAGQQQRQNDLGCFFRGRWIADLGVSAWPGESTDQFAQICLAATKYRCPHVERWCMCQRWTHDCGEYRGEGRRPIGGVHEVKLCKEVFEQGERGLSSLERRGAEYELPRIEHAETLCHLVIARLSDEFSVRLPKVGLPCHASQRQQVAKVLGIEQNAGVSCGGVTAHPVFRAPIVFFPCRGD